MNEDDKKSSDSMSSYNRSNDIFENSNDFLKNMRTINDQNNDIQNEN